MGNTPNLQRAIGNEAATTLSSTLTNSATTISVSDGSVFDATGGYAIIDEGTSSEEVVYIESVSGNTLTVSTDGRGKADTSAVSHEAGAAITDIVVKEMFNGFIDSYETEHNDDGTHGAITATSIGSSLSANGSNIDSTNRALTESGWISTSDTWTYASASDPEFTFTIAGVDRTDTLAPGMKVKLNQTTDKYFIITKVAFSTDTTVTIYGGIDYDLADAAITSPQYALPGVSPIGFPLDKTKWTYEMFSNTANNVQAAVSLDTWYNGGGSGLEGTAITGLWIPVIQCLMTGTRANTASSSSSPTMELTISTADNSESDSTLTTYGSSSVVGGLSSSSYTGLFRAGIDRALNTTLSITTPTTYYLNTRIVSTSGTLTNLGFRGDIVTTKVLLVCAYL
jgi:hypothetical protein